MHRDAEPPGAPDGEQTGRHRDESVRTSLAAERTWLAWWRTGLAASAVALAVGRLLPGVAHGAHWPYRVLGIGYGLLAIGVFLIGAWRQHHGNEALRKGLSDQLAEGSVVFLTAVSIALGIASVVVIAVAL